MSTLTLYRIDSEIEDMIALRDDILSEQGDTSQIDVVLEQYITEHLPKKVDAIAANHRKWNEDAAAARAEAKRLMAVAAELERRDARLLSVCRAVMEQRGYKRLEGHDSRLALKGNGGPEPLEIASPDLVPDEYCNAVVEMPWKLWFDISEYAVHAIPVGDKRLKSIKESRVVDNAAVRKALESPCWACDGSGKEDKDDPESVPCGACMGDGKQGVPGCQLLPRGSTVQVK